ncbi:DUF3429 domain-containing protein [Aquabacterium sp. A3]|uniref:DUF3429 domain-containing protein n=1 Tax=Aquabacterium sp. A3 TaxID=3132829 RepID=UPI00311A224B
MTSPTPHQPAEANGPATAPLAAPDALASSLGYAGLLPFVAGAVLTWLLSGRADPEPLHFAVQALVSYAALIVSFLGGLPWGLSMRWPAGDQAALAVRARALWSGIAYSLLAWVAVLMPPHAGLVVLGALLLGCYLNDRRLYPALGAAPWLTLRFRLSSVASISCWFAAAQI